MKKHQQSCKGAQQKGTWTIYLGLVFKSGCPEIQFFVCNTEDKSKKSKHVFVFLRRNRRQKNLCDFVYAHDSCPEESLSEVPQP